MSQHLLICCIVTGCQLQHRPVCVGEKGFWVRMHSFAHPAQEEVGGAGHDAGSVDVLNTNAHTSELILSRKYEASVFAILVAWGGSSLLSSPPGENAPPGVSNHSGRH